MRFACRINKATNTHSEHVIFFFYFSTATIVTRRHFKCYVLRTLPNLLLYTNVRVKIKLGKFFWEYQQETSWRTVRSVKINFEIKEEKYTHQNHKKKLAFSFLLELLPFYMKWESGARRLSKLICKQNGVSFLVGCKIILHTATSPIMWHTHPAALTLRFQKIHEVAGRLSRPLIWRILEDFTNTQSKFCLIFIPSQYSLLQIYKYTGDRHMHGIKYFPVNTTS